MTPEEFGAQLARAVRDGLPQQCRVVKVKAVDSATWTATVVPVDSEAELFDVRLRASANGATAGLLVVPKVGTTALLQLIGNDPDLAYLAHVDNADRVLVRVDGGAQLEVAGEKVKLNGDDFGGLVQVAELVRKYNALLELLEKLQHIPPSGTPAPLLLNGTPIVPGVTLAPYRVSAVDFENPNVLHG